MSFSIKQFDHKQKLGDKLKTLRKQANFKLSEVSERTKIRKTYIKWLEAGSYCKLPDSIYTRNFLKIYLRLLKADETYYLDLYEHERGTCDYIKQARMPRQRELAFSFFAASKLIKIVMLACVAIGIVFYLGLQIRTIITPPKLAVFEPFDGFVTRDATIYVNGAAEKGTKVQINGENILLSKDGEFGVEIALERGLNVLKIEGVKRYSKPAIEYRRVVLDQNKILSFAR